MPHYGTTVRNSRSNKKFGRGVVASATMALFAGVLCASWSVRAGIVPSAMLWLAPAAANPQAEKTAATQDEAGPSAEEDRAINLLMYRDRDRERLLLHAEHQFQEGNLSAGLEDLQRILDFEEDLFLRRKSDGRLASLRSEASRLLEGLDAGRFAAYERFVDADADVLLREAVRRRDPRVYEQVARRYFHTQQGFQAMHWLATRWFDHGQFSLAARTWDALEADPRHHRRLTPAMRAKARLARNLGGKRTTEPRKIIQVADSSVFPVSAGETRLDVYPSLSSGVESRRPRAWRIFQGSPDRSEGAAATTPFLTPCWTVPYGETPSDALTATLELWKDRQGKSLEPLATAGFPIVVGQKVIFRDFQGIRCVDLADGAQLWRYPCQTSLQNELNALDAKFGAGGVHSSRSSSYVQLQASYAANSVLGLLSSDGQRVYAVDRVVLDGSSAEHGSPDENSSPVVKPRKTNQLLALPLSADGTSKPQPVWAVGGLADADSAEPALAGHFFRGPPLPFDSRLFAITECQNQINLVALDPETGGLLWKQGIAFADEAFEVDHGRYPLACPIAFGDGVLVCPTQTGLLVGVDALTGTLLWSYCYAEELYQSDKRGWRERFRKSWGNDGFPAAPKIFGRRVVLLPRQSGEIHCLDVRTGRRVWKTARGDGEYIGAVTDDLVLVVGQRYCRGLSASTGEPVWTARYGMPAGQGILAEGQYLLPLETGRIATLDLETGREIGLSGLRGASKNPQTPPELLTELTARVGLTSRELPEGWRTGNLIPAGDRILASGPAGLIAFPQTGDLLAKPVRNRLLASPNDFPARLLAAELQLNLGQFAAAKTNLETVLAPGTSHQLRPHGEFLLRELLFRQLETQPADALPLLEQLETLVSSPADRGRFSMCKAEYQMRTLIRSARDQLQVGDAASVMESAEALVRLNEAGDLPWPRNPNHTISPGQFAARLMRRVREQLDPAQLAPISQHVEQNCLEALASGDRRRMQRFLTLYESWPQSASVRQRLAEMARDAGEFQRAEFLWLKNQGSRDPVVQAQATCDLMQLWSQLGLYSEAAELAEELTSPKFRDLPLKNGKTAGECVSQLPRESMLARAIGRRQFPSKTPGRVSIREDRWIPVDEELVDAFGQYRREFSLEPGSTFQLLDKGWVDETGDEPETRVAVIDRSAGVIAGKVRVPLRNSYPSLSKGAHVGHFFPVGSVNRMTGVSLLEIADEKPLWKVKLGDGASHQHILRVGPAGPGFCAFQGQQELIVLDPATGETLWKRADIDPSSGLVSDPYAGLFGDEEVLVLFAADRSSYTVFQTDTGEELYHGELKVDTGQIRRIFGRKLFYIADAPAGRRMRIWDFGANKLVFDQPAGSRIYTAITPEHELVVLIPPVIDGKPNEDSDQPSRLQILDVPADRVLLDLAVSAEDIKNLNYVRAFRVGESFYINFQRSVQMPVERLFSYYASDAFPPVENIQGDLLAIEPASGKVLWKRMLPQRSVLRMPHLRLPFLVMVSRVRDRWQGGRQGLLVEVVDARTGETIAEKDNNFSDRIVHLAYDREEGLLDLYGLKTRIRVSFGPETAKLPTEDEPL